MSNSQEPNCAQKSIYIYDGISIQREDVLIFIMKLLKELWASPTAEMANSSSDDRKALHIYLSEVLVELV